MLASFSDLPTEIWLLIAKLFSESQLSDLKSVNSFFLNCWMDLRWQLVTVEINSRYSKSLIRLLNHVADPFVAVRMKSLHIYLKSKRLASRSASRHSFTAILAVLPVLPNITSLDIELIENSNFHVDAFFRAITSSPMAMTLRRLYLSGDVEVFAPFVTCSVNKRLFKNLTHLILDLKLDDTSKIEASLTLEPFLRYLAPNLQILRIFTRWPEPDLSPLFNALLQPDTPVLFPNLRTLFISVHIDLSFRMFPRALHRFLLTYINLQHLHLNLLRDIPENDPNIEKWGIQFADLLNSSQFSSLQSLAVHPSSSQAGLSAVLTLVKRTARTLSSLQILDRYLTYEEVKQLVDAIAPDKVRVRETSTTMMATPTTREESGTLKSLTMNITELTISILDLLAHKLPQLEKLSLEVLEIQYSFYHHIHERTYNPYIISTKDILHTWKLHELSIMKYWEDDMAIVQAVANAIPALFREVVSGHV